MKIQLWVMVRSSATIQAISIQPGGNGPVNFRYKKDIDPQGVPEFGLVAEEVEKINPALVIRDPEGRPYTVRYERVNAMLLNEFLKEHRKVDQLQKQVEGPHCWLSKNKCATASHRFATANGGERSVKLHGLSDGETRLSRR